MSKKFNLDLSKINSKKVPVVAKIESIYNIDYEELGDDPDKAIIVASSFNEFITNLESRE